MKSKTSTITRQAKVAPEANLAAALDRMESAAATLDKDHGSLATGVAVLTERVAELEDALAEEKEGRRVEVSAQKEKYEKQLAAVEAHNKALIERHDRVFQVANQPLSDGKKPVSVRSYQED